MLVTVGGLVGDVGEATLGVGVCVSAAGVAVADSTVAVTTGTALRGVAVMVVIVNGPPARSGLVVSSQAGSVRFPMVSRNRMQMNMVTRVSRVSDARGW